MDTCYTGMDNTHQHIWYDFWDADLGRPIGPKALQYQNIEGLFIREFTNGWAVYNRSGSEQSITLPVICDLCIRQGKQRCVPDSPATGPRR